MAGPTSDLFAGCRAGEIKLFYMFTKFATNIAYQLGQNK